MTEKQILKKLKNDHEYYNGIGRNYLSNSNIEALTTEPRQFQAPQKDGEAFVKGRYFHQLILEKEKAKGFPIIDAPSRSTKVYKEFIADNKLDYALLTKDADHIKDMVDYTLESLPFFDLINDPTAQYEVPAIGKIMGEEVMWKGKADIIIPGKCVIDLKTSGDVFKFVRNAPYYFYHTQSYIYQKLFGLPVVFLVTGKTKKYDKERKRYYDLGIFPTSENSMGLAEEKVGQAVASYNKWFAPDSQDNIDSYIINTPI
jgi:hypothetical protein